MHSRLDYDKEIDRLSRQIDKALTYLHEQVGEWARSENEYRMAKAVAYLAQPTGTVQAKQYNVDKVCELERLRCHLAEGNLKAAHAALRSRTSQLNAAQSKLSAWKQEAKFEQTKP